MDGRIIDGVPERISKGEAMRRREFLPALAAMAAAMPATAAQPSIDTHIHLFDPARFPYSPLATYKPEPATLDDYKKFLPAAGYTNVVIVHPEPYQDDHRYLEYCFDNEPRAGFFKGTCLFDPLLPDTPMRMAQLMKKYPRRIVALRIHQNRKAGAPPSPVGTPIRERDMAAPEMKKTWQAAADLRLAIQMHFTPNHAPSIAKLAQEFPETPVILDHLGRKNQGTPEEYERVIALGKLPNTIMKLSGWAYCSSEPPPHDDLKPTIRRIYDTFGPDRMMLGVLGMDPEKKAVAAKVFATQLAFASERDRQKMRAGNAQRLFGFA